jgi:4-hydroxybenzoate polyprenyltransferase
VLTQYLFECCIYLRIYPSENTADRFSILNSQWRFTALVIASVLIAAAGYIINDYFDQNIDEINKPEKMVVNRIIKRRWVIFWHLLLSMAGLFITMLALPMQGFWHLVLANMSAIIALWFYSTNLKKQLLVGNILISLLTAWVIFILFFSKYPLHISELFQLEHHKVRFFRLTILYASFAFIISLIREVVKDMEDIEGDRKYGCTTLPIVWGIRAAKVFVAVWVVVLIALLIILQIYALGLGWWHSALYCVLFIIAPLMVVLKKLFKASTPIDYHRISTIIKLVMFTGILSMIFFRLYN